MRKQTAALLTSLLLLSCITGCSDNKSIPSDKKDNFISSPSHSAELSKPETVDSVSSSNDENKIVRVNYGDAEIPDIHYEKITEEGSAIFIADDNPISGTLDAMIFETHTVGDYTFSLVGENVRTDLANFPDKIFAKSLYVEVLKNGMLIENGKSNLRDESTGVSNARFECFVMKDKIGNYVDLYELEKPIIAVHYFYPDDGREVTSVVSFNYIKDHKLYDHNLGIHSPKTGIVIDTMPGLAMNDGSGEYNKVFGRLKDVTVNGDLTWCSITASDELLVVDDKTLEDNVAGIRYAFDFDNADDTILYKTTKI